MTEVGVVVRIAGATNGLVVRVPRWRHSWSRIKTELVLPRFEDEDPAPGNEGRQKHAIYSNNTHYYRSI